LCGFTGDLLPLEADRAAARAAPCRRQFSSVDLPAPLAPISATISPASIGQAHAAQRLDAGIGRREVLDFKHHFLPPR
jgi:hypothetical protein